MPKQTGIKTFFQPKSSDTSDFSQNENPKQDHSAKKTDSSIIDQLCDDKFENIKNSKLKLIQMNAVILKIMRLKMTSQEIKR